MTTILKELHQKRDELDAQIRAVVAKEAKETLVLVKSLVKEFDFSSNDIFGKAGTVKGSSRAGGKVAAKYRNPADGATWTGRGKPPLWIANQDRSQFLIHAETTE